VPDSAGEQTPAITSQKARDKKTFAEGGGDKMVPRQAAEPARPGRTGKPLTPPGSKHATAELSLAVKPKDDGIGGLQTGC